MNHFTQICLNTFILFFGYWLFVAIAPKISKAIRKSTSFTPSLFNHFPAIIKSKNFMRKVFAIKKSNDEQVKINSSTEKEFKIGSDDLHSDSQNIVNINVALISSELKEIDLSVIEESFELENSSCGDVSGNSAETNLKPMAPYEKSNIFCHENKNKTEICSVEPHQNKEIETVDNFQDSYCDDEPFHKSSMKSSKKEGLGEKFGDAMEAEMESIEGRDIFSIEMNICKEGDEEELFLIEEEIKDNRLCYKLQEIKQNKLTLEENLEEDCSLKEKEFTKNGENEQLFAHHEHSTKIALLNQIHQFEIENQNLRNEIGEAEIKIKRLEECESDQKREIAHLKKELLKVNKSNMKTLYVRSKKSNIHEETNENLNTQVSIDDIKVKIVKANKRSKVFIEQNEATKKEQKTYFNCHHSHKWVSQVEKTMEKSQRKERYRFLSDCCFLASQDKGFLYEQLEELFSGSLKTEKFYNSKQNSSKNPHALIDNIRNILLVIELENGKIIGGYTSCAFTPLTPNSVSENIAYLFDISNMKSFKNRTGKNSTIYSVNCVIWGMNELTMSFERPKDLMTHFGNSEGIFWDGEYRREDLVGVDKEWVSINQYELYRVSSE